MSVNPLPVLHVQNDTWVLRLRLLRVWGKLYHTGDSLQQVNLLFINNQGQLVEGIIRRPHLNRFLSSLHEGRVYGVMSFYIEENNSIHRVAEADFRLSFRSNTLLYVMEDTGDIEKFSFRFLAVNDIPYAFQNQTYLPDLVGTIFGCEPAQVLYPGLPVRKKRIKLLLTEGELAYVFLSDSAIPSFEEVVSDAGTLGQIAVFTSLFIEQNEGGYSFSSSRATKMYLNIHCPHLHPLLNQEDGPRFGSNIREDGPQFGSNYIVGPLLYEEALDISEHTTVPQLNMIKLSLYSTGTVYIMKGKLQAIRISTSAHSMVSVVHFTINDVAEELEVVFPSVNLRRIVGDVVAETDIDWDTNIIAILNSIDLKYYQFLIEVGAWNRMVRHCDLVLMKMFSADF